MSTTVSYLSTSSDLDEVISRIKAVEGARFDADVASVLDMDRRALAGYKKRGTLPMDALMLYAAKKGLSLDFLVFGQGPEKRADRIAEPTPTYATSPAQYNLFIDIAHTVDALFKEAGVQVGREVTQDKRDHLVFYIYNDHIKQGFDNVQREAVRGAVQLIL